MRIPGRKGLLATVLVVAMAVLSSACVTTTSTGPTEIKLGFIGPVTGTLAELGQAQKRAVDMAVEQVNSQGGLDVGGRKYMVKLVVGDEEGLVAERAVAATQRLIEQEQVVGIVGYVISSNVLASMPLVQQSKIPTINTVGKAGSIPERVAKEKMDYFFQVSPTNDELVASHGRLLAKLVKPKKLAFVMINTDAGRDYEKRARVAWEKLMPGLEMQAYFVESDRQDFQPEILKLKQFMPDAIYVLLVGTHVFAWVDQFAASGLADKMVVFGDSDYAAPNFPDRTGAKTNLQLANAVTFEAPITPLTVPFFQEYTKKHNAGPPYYAVQTYDGMLMMFEGIRRAGRLTGNVAEDRTAIKAGLEKITPENPVTGLRGKLSFTPLEQGRRVPAEVAVVQFQDGKRVLIWPEAAATGQYKDPRSK